MWNWGGECAKLCSGDNIMQLEMNRCALGKVGKNYNTHRLGCRFHESFAAYVAFLIIAPLGSCLSYSRNLESFLKMILLLFYYCYVLPFLLLRAVSLPLVGWDKNVNM